MLNIEFEVKNAPKYKYPKGYRAYLVIERKISRNKNIAFSVSIDGENQGQLWREIDLCVSEIFRRNLLHPEVR